MLGALAAEDGVESIHTVARRDLPAAGAGEVGGARVVHTRADLREPAARRALAGVDVLFHLGFQLWRGADGDAGMAAANLDGTANVLEAHPGRVVLLSSAAVYGAWPDNPCPLPESATPRPNPECPYAGQKLAVERMCAGAVPTVSLRVGAVLGPGTDERVRKALQGYRWAVPAVAGVAQAVQFVHQDDVVDACLAAWRTLAGGASAGGAGAGLSGAAPSAAGGSGAGGRPGSPAAGGAGAEPSGGSGEVLNVAPADWLDARGVAAITGGRVLPLPRTVLLGASRAAHRLGLTPFGADRSVLLSGPLALDVERASTVIGWRARRSSAETLASMFARPRPGPPPGV